MQHSIYSFQHHATHPSNKKDMKNPSSLVFRFFIGLLVSAPIAAFVWSIFISSSLKGGLDLSKNEDFLDIIKSIATSILWLPLYFIVKNYIKNGGVKLNIKFSLLLFLLSFIIFYEFESVYIIFLSKKIGIDFNIKEFTLYFINNMASRWFYPAPMAVIFIGMLQFSGILPRILPDGLDEIEDLSNSIHLAIIAIISLIISLLIRILFSILM